MQQQTNFFTPTQKHLIQLHGFPNITDIIYVKPLYSVRSLVVYPGTPCFISIFSKTSKKEPKSYFASKQTLDKKHEIIYRILYVIFRKIGETM